MVGSLPDCCACAGSGATAALAERVMNSRRLIDHSLRRSFSGQRITSQCSSHAMPSKMLRGNTRIEPRSVTGQGWLSAPCFHDLKSLSAVPQFPAMLVIRGGMARECHCRHDANGIHDLERLHPPVTDPGARHTLLRPAAPPLRVTQPR